MFILPRIIKSKKHPSFAKLVSLCVYYHSNTNYVHRSAVCEIVNFMDSYELVGDELRLVHGFRPFDFIHVTDEELLAWEESKLLEKIHSSKTNKNSCSL